MTTRRNWLTGTLGLGLAAIGRGGLARTADDPPGAVEAARARAKEAGLGAFRSVRKGHYEALGDAPEGFLAEALGLCEQLALSYQRHFQGRGIGATLPQKPMLIVVLSGPDAYAKFKGTPAAEGEGGHYDVEASRLVIFDFRKAGGDPRTNTFTLVHEAIHQLTFDTGFLDRKAVPPKAVSEGLATYGETWTRKKPELGQVNRLRLAVLKSGPWIPIEALLTRDEAFEDPDREQSAYAGAWLFAYHFLKYRDRTPKLLDYLKRIAARDDGKSRADDATAALGDLAVLDQELKRLARRV